MTNVAPELLEVAAGGVRWRILPGCQDLLLGPTGLRLDEWLRDGCAQVVKHGPHRTVYRVALPGLSFHLKHYRLPDIRAWLRQLVRPAKARTEFVRALAVAARRVPTVVPLALGERWLGPRPSDSYLITRSLENAEPLSHFIETTLPGFAPPRCTRIRQLLAHALGEFVAQLHNTGISHRDLHAANMLVRLEENERPCLYLIDLHAVHLGQPLNWARSRENLVILNRWFVLRASRADRFRFWRTYCRKRAAVPAPWPSLGKSATLAAGPRSPVKNLAADLEYRTWQSNLRFWRHRDRRCLDSNRYYQAIRADSVIGHAVRDLDRDALTQLLCDPDAPFTRPGIRLLKDSRSSTVTEFDICVDGHSRRVIYKRFRATAWTDPWVALLRRPGALRSWIYGHGLRERCLPTPRPLAVFHRRRMGLLLEGYLLTEKIPEAMDLHEFLARLQSANAAERARRLWHRIEQVARLICALHCRQISHRDLKATNLLVAGAALWLIDLVGIRAFRRLSRTRRVQNLARLHASFHQNPSLTRTDKLRFLRVYLQWGLFGHGGWKRWWREIAVATHAKVRRNERNGRPLA